MWHQKEKTMITIKQIETSSCKTTYLVNKENSSENFVLFLSMVTGGIPMLSFDDYSFSKRYPVVEKWDNSHWNQELGLYDHQDKDALQGPTFEVLPDGEKTIEQFLEKNASLIELRIRRYNDLPLRKDFLHTDGWGRPFLNSRRFLDKEARSYVSFSVGFSPLSFSASVLVISARCFGAFPDVVEKFAPEWWKKYNKFTSGLKNNPYFYYELLTDTEYTQLCLLLEEGFAHDEFVINKS